jgi:hypothetical protein
MQKILISYVALLMVLISADSVCALGSDIPKGPVGSPQWPAGLTELLNRPNRVHGYFINQMDVYFYTGDVSAFNEFIAQYAALKGTSLSLTLRPGRGTANSPWDKEKTTPCDWFVNVRRIWSKDAPADRATTKPSFSVSMSLYLGGQIDLKDVKVPLSVEVMSDGSIERFIKEHEARRASLAGEQQPQVLKQAVPVQLLTEPQKLRDDPFAIYLLQDASVTGKDVLKLSLDLLPLQPEPLLTLDDFTSYSWTDHSFGLTPQATKKIPSPKSVFGLPFVVVSRGKRLYLGAFYSSVSSASFPAPVIDVFESRLPGSGWKIARAYPGTGVGERPDDPRANPAIKEVFEKAGKLK